MGILNVTPDSFSDGGQFVTLDKALRQVAVMLEEGADIIDVGGESTRPGAQAADERQELDRVLPVIEAITQRFDTIVSIDTSKASVMRAAVAAGVGMINDVRALREPGALQAAAHSALPVCLMHMQGEPRTMQHKPVYVDVVQEVSDFLQSRRQACIDAGIDAARIVVDPGFGFGKTLEHNLQLLRHLDRLGDAAPILIGLSRKRMFAQILGSDCASRVTASVSAALLCVQHGASIVRVHDVAPTVQALAVWRAVQAVP
jgi:dihydropteroate synthase